MCLKLLIKLFGLDTIDLTKEEKRDLKRLEREAYVTKAKELSKKRGEQKAKDKYDY
jgi:hypothetical protein